MDAWRELDEPWRASLELAWEAYLVDTIPGPQLGRWPARLSAALQSAFWEARPDHPRAAEIVEAFGDETRRAGECVLEVDGTAARLEEALPQLLDCL